MLKPKLELVLLTLLVLLPSISLAATASAPRISLSANQLTVVETGHKNWAWNTGPNSNITVTTSVLNLSVQNYVPLFWDNINVGLFALNFTGCNKGTCVWLLEMGTGTSSIPSTYNVTLTSTNYTSGLTTSAKLKLTVIANTTSPNYTAPTDLITLYVGKNLSSGPWTVQLQNLGQANSNGMSPALFNIYYHNVLTNSTAIIPGATASFSFNGSTLYLPVNQTFAGLYAYQKWARITPWFTPAPTIYISINQNVTAGPWTISAYALGEPTSSGEPPVYVHAAYGCSSGFCPYSNGTTLLPRTTAEFSHNGSTVYVAVNQTFHGLYSYQSWTKLEAWFAPATASQTTTTTTVTTTTTTISPLYGCNILTTLYVGGNLTCQRWMVQLANLGNPTASGISAAIVNIYYNRTETNSSSIYPPSAVKYLVSGQTLYLTVNQTFYGLYQYQKWAKVVLAPSSPTITTTATTTTTSVITTSISTTVTSVTTSTTTIKPKPSPSYAINYQAGWNLFSVPLAYVSALNSSCQAGALGPIWHLQSGKYVKANFLYGGLGYWVRSSASCSVTYYGPPLTLSSLPSLTPGWNMIGALNYSTSLSNIVGNCDVVGGPFGYNISSGSYYSTMALRPGAGYFINVTTSCSLGSPAPPPPP